MKVTETYREPTGPYYDNAGPWTISLESNSGVKYKMSANEPEPEDASFGRDLSFVFDISKLLHVAYEAGKAGEDYTYQYIEEKEN